MRKKSHISLARYLVRELRKEGLAEHRKAFYLGSVQPDLTLKMIAHPHEYRSSYDDLQERIRDIVQGRFQKERVLWRQIGIVMHYLADYFTLPHNSFYEGSLKDHCQYEKQMKLWMRRYVRTPEAMMVFRQQRAAAMQISSLEMLFANIETAHREYTSQKQIHTVEDDCRWILSVCSSVLIYFISSGKPASRRIFFAKVFEEHCRWQVRNKLNNCAFDKKCKIIL